MEPVIFDLHYCLVTHIIVIIHSIFEMKAQQSVQNSFESRTTISSSSNTLVVSNNNMSSSTSVVGRSSNDPNLT
ncbi:unnamed protein product [Rotaria sordida]|uniref:Uncharacterized protein n=1 Tax=Rotaria sordida TaxID=392033 RepID=A0A815DPN3_9BILA|nr:unnamed protein product [Rotaria sordida]CAF1576368.1 unnamed protein product [Rotaria sordida]